MGWAVSGRLSSAFWHPAGWFPLKPCKCRRDKGTVQETTKTAPGQVGLDVFLMQNLKTERSDRCTQHRANCTHCSPAAAKGVV